MAPQTSQFICLVVWHLACQAQPQNHLATSQVSAPSGLPSDSKGAPDMLVAQPLGLLIISPSLEQSRNKTLDHICRSMLTIKP